MNVFKMPTISRRTLLRQSSQAIAGVSLAGGLGTLLEACGSDASTANGPVTLRFAMLNDPGEIKNARALGDAFTKANPSVKFSYEPIASASYLQKILTDAAGSTLPDIFWLADVYVRQPASKGVMLALDSSFQRDKVDTSDMYASMMGLGKYNDKLYVVPRDYNHVVTYYNQDAFTKAGLTAPSMDWTYDEFLAACEALVSKGGVKYAIDFSTWWAIYVPFVRGFGGDMLSPDNKSVAFTSSQALAGLKAFTDLVAKGYAVNPANAPTTDPFTSGEAAMTWSVRPIVSSLTSGIGKNFSWNATRFPKLPQNPVIGAGMSGYAASAQTAHADQAARFLEFIVSSAGQQIFEATGNSVPVLKSLQNDSTWLSLPRADFNNKAYFYDNQHDTLPPSVPVSAQDAYDTAITTAFTSVFLNKATVQDAFHIAAAAINSTLANAS